MSIDVTDSLTLRASKGRFQGYFLVALLFLVITLFADFPRTALFLVYRILFALACLFAMAVFVTGWLSNKYNAVLSRDGIEFGTFYGRQRYKWSEIRATGVIRPTTGERVFIELMPPAGLRNEMKPPVKYLPDTYGMDAEELAKTILRWKREYGVVPNN